MERKTRADETTKREQPALEAASASSAAESSYRMGDSLTLARARIWGRAERGGTLRPSRERERAARAHTIHTQKRNPSRGGRGGWTRGVQRCSPHTCTQPPLQPPVTRIKKKTTVFFAPSAIYLYGLVRNGRCAGWHPPVLGSGTIGGRAGTNGDGPTPPRTLDMTQWLAPPSPFRCATTLLTLAGR